LSSAGGVAEGGHHEGVRQPPGRATDNWPAAPGGASTRSIICSSTTNIATTVRMRSASSRLTEELVGTERADQRGCPRPPAGPGPSGEVRSRPVRCAWAASHSPAASRKQHGEQGGRVEGAADPAGSAVEAAGRGCRPSAPLSFTRSTHRPDRQHQQHVSGEPGSAPAHRPPGPATRPGAATTPSRWPAASDSPV